MKYSAILSAVGMLALAACGGAERAPEQSTTRNQAQSTQQKVYSGSGTVTAVAGDQVTIDHGPIEAVGWPAMTMTFTAPEGVAAGIGPGADVEFSFHDDDGTYVLSSIRQR